MKRYYCTYFDRNYLVRAIALIESLSKHENNDFQLFAVCHDEISRIILNKLNSPNVTIVPMHEIEQGDASLVATKKNRSLIEYYWTAGPTIILWLLEHNPGIDVLTYLDADLFFFSSPDPIFDELGDNSVLIHEHRFSPSLMDRQVYGKYNVGLLCFRNDEIGLKVLNRWRQQCIEWCYVKRSQDGKFADQVYLNDWPRRFERVTVLQNVGAGVAPWNYTQYSYDVDKSNRIFVNGTPLIFYHFHELKFVSPDVIVPFTGYPVLLKILKICYLRYVDALSRGISTIRSILPDFMFGLDRQVSLSADYTFLAKHNLSADIKKFGVSQAPVAMDDNWDCYCSNRLVYEHSPSLKMSNEHKDCIRREIKTLNGVANDTRLDGNDTGLEVCKERYLVSAIVSTCNSERFIRGCLDDLERQTIADRIEIIVVNSGSQQNEETIIHEYQQKYDNIRYVKTEKCETIYKAWNRAIEIAHGKYITNANTDDRRRPDAMEVMVGVFENNPDVGLVYANQILTHKENAVFEDNTLSEKYVYPDFRPDIFLELGYCKIGSQPMWLASIHKEAGLFDDTFEVAGDYDFLLRVCDKYKCFHIPEFLGTFYRSGESVSCKKSFRLNRIENPIAKSRAFLRKGVQCVEGHDFAGAIRYLGFSLRLWPSREATQYLKIASEKKGCKKIVADEEIKRLQSIYELPGSKSESDMSQLVPNKGYWNSNTRDTLVSAVVYPDLKLPSYDCLEELEKQTIANRLEVIVIDRNSDSEDNVVLAEFKQRYENIKIVDSNETETIGTALNRAVKGAAGKYIALLSKAYHYRPDSLELMVKALDSDSNSAALYINEKENPKSKVDDVFVQNEAVFSHDRLLQENFIELPVLWHRDLHEQIGCFDEVFVSANCYEFWLRIAQRCNFMCLDVELKNARPEQNNIGDDRFADYFETAAIQKSYQYAYLNSILIGNGGISQTKPFSDWCETNIIKKKTKERLSNRELDPIEKVYDISRGDKLPLLSVVVVTYNRVAELFENIKALNEQTEANFELIVINNGQTIPQFGQEAGNWNFNSCYIELKSNYGPSLGRNIGTKFARAQYVAFLDDDAVADRDFVSNIVKHFREYNICGLRGKVLSKMGDFNASFSNLGEEVVPSTIESEGNCAFRKDVFLEHNGFDECLFHGEGSDLAYRIYKAGDENLQSILYFPDVIIYHDSYVVSRDNIEELVRYDMAEKLLLQKDNGIALYLSFFSNFYPDSRDEVEKSYVRMLDNVSFLQKCYPEQAVIWAQKAAQLNPAAITCRYILGSLYIKLGKYTQAQIVFESIFKELSDKLSKSDLQSLKSDFEDTKVIGLCYCDSVLKLAQCYIKQNKFNDAKYIYEELLKEKYISMSQEQKARIHAELSKIDGDLYSLATAESRGIANVTAVSNNQYDVSIVLCTKNRAELLEQMLVSLKEAAEGVSYEVIVVEGGSSDNTLDVLRKHNITKLYSESEWLGPGKHSWPQLYNFGFSKARGKWAMYASDDITFSENCISKALEILNEQSNDVAGGIFYYKNLYPANPQWADFGIDFTYGQKLLMNYGLLRLDYFRQFGGLDEAYRFYCADSDLCLKLYEKAKQLIPLPGCFITHNNVLDVQKKENLRTSNADIDLLLKRWRNFVPTQLPNPRRLIWQQNLLEESDIGKNIIGLIFSKDRAMQLRAALESFFSHCVDSEQIKLFVLYQASNQLHQRQYNNLKKDFGNITFIKETNFKQQLLAIVEGSEYVLFLVDDNLFVKDFCLADVVKSLRENKDTVGFSLRLGKNTNYCYSHDSKQSLPLFQKVDNGILKYNWTAGEYDFGYPLELSSSLYRTSDILILLDKLEFTHPNILEDMMAANAQLYAQTKNCLLCYENSVAFCNPINKVQSVWNNRSCTDGRYSAERLAEMLEGGARIDVEKFSGFVPNSCHQEVQVCFKTKDRKQSPERKRGVSPPQFSIIMANYNKEKYIAEAIEFVLNQTFTDWELIIIDDCSTDDSPNVIERYLNDTRIKLIQHKENRGKTAALRAGIASVRSEYFGILDSDDCLLPNAVETMHAYHVKFPDCGLIYSQFTYCHQDLTRRCVGFCDKIPAGKTALDLNVVSHFQTFKLRDYLKTSGYDENILYAEDIDIVYRMEEVTSLKFVDECLYLYRELPDSVCHSKDKINVAIMSRVKAKINALERRCDVLAKSSGKNFEDLFAQAIKQARAAHKDVEQYFVILAKLYENNLLDLSLPADFKRWDAEDRLLWLAANVDIKFDKLFELLAPRQAWGGEQCRTAGQVKVVSQPFVTVYMVTYNAQKFISQAIDSVLSQVYKNFEFLIVDDGSTDKTKELVASYSDNRIRYIYKEHKNCASGVNRAIAEAKGKYIMVVDSDDFIAPDYIEKMVAFAEKHPQTDYFYPAQLTIVNESGNPTGQQWSYMDFSDNSVLPSFLFKNCYGPIPNPGSLKRKTLFDKVGLYDEVDTIEDFVFLCKNALKINFKRIDEHSTYFYRRHRQNTSLKFDARNRIMADVLNEMVSIYPAEVLYPQIVDISDADLKEQRYYEYVAETFYRHSNGPMVQFGHYFQKYADYYKSKLLRITAPAAVLRQQDAGVPK